MKFFYAIVMIFVFIFSCDEPLPPDPSLILNSQSSAIIPNEEFDISLELKDNGTPIFGIYVKIDYDSSFLSFSDTTGFAVGNYFGGNNITFAKEENGSVFLTITLTQGEEKKSGTGLLGSLTFSPKLEGTTAMSIDEEELEFYNDFGDIIEIINIETKSLLIEIK